MFTGLTLKIEGDIIHYSAGELLTLVMTLVQSPQNEKILIPQAGLFNHFTASIAPKMDDGELLKGKLDPFLTVPIHLTGMDTPKKWLYAAQKLAEDFEANPLQGWWMKVADRLILIKNTKDFRFYVSDHGDIHDIQENVMSLVLGEIDWTDENHMAAVAKVEKHFKSIGDEAVSALHEKIMDTAKKLPLNVLKKENPHLTDAELLQMQADLASADFRKNQKKTVF